MRTNGDQGDECFTCDQCGDTTCPVSLTGNKPAGWECGSITASDWSAPALEWIPAEWDPRVDATYHLCSKQCLRQFMLTKRIDRLEDEAYDSRVQSMGDDV